MANPKQFTFQSLAQMGAGVGAGSTAMTGSTKKSAVLPALGMALRVGVEAGGVGAILGVIEADRGLDFGAKKNVPGDALLAATLLATAAGLGMAGSPIALDFMFMAGGATSYALGRQTRKMTLAKKSAAIAHAAAAASAPAPGMASAAAPALASAPAGEFGNEFGADPVKVAAARLKKEAIDTLV